MREGDEESGRDMRREGDMRGGVREEQEWDRERDEEGRYM